LVPLRIEARAVRAGAPGADIEQIGMGPVRATATRARVSRSLAVARPLVLVGVAGGLVNRGEPGHVVVASSISLVDSDDVIALQEAHGVAELLTASNLEVEMGRIASSPEIVHGDERRRDIAASGAIAVDMESYWCAPLAAQHPLTVVRVLLDVPGRNLRSPAMVPAAVKAYRSLKAVARILAQWSPVSVNEDPFMEVGDR
jgi:4-hydroxy-3-methylbut-2-enyl diphosphate reductase